MSFAATPNLQRALVLEAQGNLGAAVYAATDATRQESTNWRTWLTLSRIDWEAGRAKPAVAAYRTGALAQPALAAVPARRSGVMAERLDPRRNRAKLESRAAERRRLQQIARLLDRSRPEPRAAFRADLGQRLQVEPRRAEAPAPDGATARR